MADPYQTPVGELRESLTPRAYSHAVIGAISNFVVYLTANIVPAINGVQVDEAKALLEATLSSIVMAMLLLSFRRLPWYVALLIGPIVGFLLVFVGFVVIGFLGVDY